MKRDFRSQLALERQTRSEKKVGRNCSHYSSTLSVEDSKPFRYYTSQALLMKEVYISARGGNLKGYALQVYVGGLKDFIGQQYHIPLGGNTFKFDQNVFLDPETYVEITIVEEGGDDVDRKPPNWVSIDFISEIK